MDHSTQRPGLRRVGLRSRRVAVAAPILAVVIVAASACSSESARAPLPKLDLDPSRTTVSGLSSGAYMATQVHMAFSDHVAGVALLAGGPYGCAQGSLETALSSCLNPASDKLPDVDALVESSRQRATAGVIAPLAGLSGDTVFVMHGSLDTTVGAGISEAAAEFYRRIGGAVVEEDNTRAMAHTFPTTGSGSACAASESPYLGKCGFDGAGEILGKLHAGTAAPLGAAQGEGKLRNFDQKAYLPEGEDAMLADTGYVYVPNTCASGETCTLHIVFHGCQQNADAIGETFVRDAGYNRWADALRLVVLYPQTRATYAPLNPKACWDWWGYSGTDYDTRNGVQLRWLANAAAALGAPLQ